MLLADCTYMNFDHFNVGLNEGLPSVSSCDRSEIVASQRVV